MPLHCRDEWDWNGGKIDLLSYSASYYRAFGNEQQKFDLSRVLSMGGGKLPPQTISEKSISISFVAQNAVESIPEWWKYQKFWKHTPRPPFRTV